MNCLIWPTATYLTAFLAMQATQAPGVPIVGESDPSIVTHKIRCGSIILGFSDLGGGYLNYINLGDGKNINSARYGRGWQHSLRDMMHSGRYNPTQAGFRDFAGAPVRLLVPQDESQNQAQHLPMNKDPDAHVGRLIIPPFNMPLYGDPVFDFTENEDLFPDWPGYKDDGTADTDGLNEDRLTQDDELRSEFDFEGLYEDVSGWVGRKTSVVRHQFLYAYVREPKAIYQFGKKARLLNGKPVINESYRVADLSPSVFPGSQVPSDVDLSLCVMTSYGARVLTGSGYEVFMWREGANWVVQENMPVKGQEMVHMIPSQLLDYLGPNVNLSMFDTGHRLVQRRSKNSGTANRRKTQFCESDFIVISKGIDADSSEAIGLYMPQNSTLNRFQVVGRETKTGREVYSEDRRVQSFLIATHRIPGQWSIRSRQILTGLLAPENGREGVCEGIRGEVFLLFGSPSEILESVETLNKRFEK